MIVSAAALADCHSYFERAAVALDGEKHAVVWLVAIDDGDKIFTCHFVIADGEDDVALFESGSFGGRRAADSLNLHIGCIVGVCTNADERIAQGIAYEAPAD